jgi:hypothetical protein
MGRSLVAEAYTLNLTDAGFELGPALHGRTALA